MVPLKNQLSLKCPIQARDHTVPVNVTDTAWSTRSFRNQLLVYLLWEAVFKLRNLQAHKKIKYFVFLNVFYINSDARGFDIWKSLSGRSVDTISASGLIWQISLIFTYDCSYWNKICTLFNYAFQCTALDAYKIIWIKIDLMKLISIYK